MTATRIQTGAARSLRLQLRSPKWKSSAATGFSLRVGQVKRTLANIRDTQENGVWFSNSIPCSQLSDSGPRSGNDHKPPDERTLKLGKTIRILHDRLPTLLVSPLPQEILSPQITLRLFPSTHPHLPTVSGKIAYVAALWTSPVAWGRLPVVGNVKIHILSERMVRNDSSPDYNTSYRTEKLIVKWKTCGKHPGGTNSDARMTQASSDGHEEDDKEFCGLFIFEFDEEGRIVTHTIEHVEEGGNWERKTARVVSVTDWLLGRAWGKKEDDIPGLALGYCEADEREVRRSRK